MKQGNYELTYIARPDIAPADLNAITDDLKKIIAEGKGELVREENWGLRPLAYIIKKNKRGHYVHLVFKAESTVVDEINRVLGLNENVLRRLAVRVEKVSNDPSIIMRREENNEQMAA